MATSNEVVLWKAESDIPLKQAVSAFAFFKEGIEQAAGLSVLREQVSPCKTNIAPGANFVLRGNLMG